MVGGWWCLDPILVFSLSLSQAEQYPTNQNLTFLFVSLQPEVKQMFPSSAPAPAQAGLSWSYSQLIQWPTHPKIDILVTKLTKMTTNIVIQRILELMFPYN